MTEYWKSQAKKFCDFCKCWISDNKASISFHENGRRHQQAVENKLYDIRKKGRLTDRKVEREEQWMKEIEAKAMKDYRSKDLESKNSDITAQIFHQKRAQRDEERKNEESEPCESSRAQLAAQEACQGSSIGPQVEGAVLKKVEAPTSGTKWHKSEAKMWYEAKQNGTTYYWNVETMESCWEPPPEGFLSLKEQKNINKKQEKREMKRAKTIEASQAIHGTKSEEISVTQGPQPKATPYGQWTTVESPVDVGPVDYQVPKVKEAPQANVTMHSDKLTKFEEKKTPSLGGNSSNSTSSKPAIVFRKRKLNDEHRKNSRKRDLDD